MNGRKRKVITQEVLKRREYATFLKRIRLDRGYTQEQIAKDVCTVSYYSRIENNLVDVGDDYFVLLFKKFNIDYFTLKEEKNHEIFIDVIKNILLSDLDSCTLLIEKALKKEFYCQIEYELMMLFDAVNKNLFNEAFVQIREIDAKYDSLLEYESIFFLYLISMYYYKSCKGVLAVKQVKVLFEYDHVDPVYKYAIIDLALDIFFFTGCYDLFFKYYNDTLNSDFITSFPNCCLKHKAQYIYITDCSNKEECFNKINELENSNQINKEEIDWLLFMNITCFKKLNEQINFLRSMKKDKRSLAAEALLVLQSDSKNIYKEFLDRKYNYYFDSCFSFYEGICNCVIRIKNDDDLVNTYILLKELVNQSFDANLDFYFYSIIKRLLIEVGIKVSRYKDVCNFVLDLVQREDFRNL